MDYKKLNKKSKTTIEQMIADGVITQEVAIKYFPELAESKDERIRKECISIIDAWDKSCRLQGDYCESASTCIAWLKKQGKQNLTWSKEDEKILKSIIINIENLQFSEDMRGKYWHVPNTSKNYYQIMIDWLKSLKERVGNFDNGYKVGFSAAKHNQWKPSDEQMHYLSWIANIKLGDSVVEQEVSKHLNELFEDLKKLK